MIFFFFWLTYFSQWTEYFKKELVPSRGRLKVVSPKLKHRLGLGAPLKQSCSGAIEKDQSSTFINRVDLPLSPHPVHQVQQRQGSLPSHSYPSHSRVPFFSAAQGPQQTGSFSPQHLSVPAASVSRLPLSEPLPPQSKASARSRGKKKKKNKKTQANKKR